MQSAFAQKAGAALDVALGWIAGAILMVMMLLTACDVFARYAFNSPIRGAFELTEVALVLLIYAGLPLVSRREQHVVVDLFEAWMTPAVKQALRVLGNLLCMVAMAGMAWVIYAKRVVDHNDTTSVLKLPLVPVAVAMAVLILITGLVHIGLIFTKPTEEEATSAL